jgi:hypothetical protein
LKRIHENIKHVKGEDLRWDRGSLQDLLARFVALVQLEINWVVMRQMCKEVGGEV